MLFIFPSLEPLWNSLAQLQVIPAAEIVSSCFSTTSPSISLLLARPAVYCTRRGCFQLLGRSCLRLGKPEAQCYPKAGPQRQREGERGCTEENPRPSTNENLCTKNRKDSLPVSVPFLDAPHKRVLPLFAVHPLSFPYRSAQGTLRSPQR